MFFIIFAINDILNLNMAFVCIANTLDPQGGLALGDTWDFLLNKYFVELNTDKFNFLNQFLK